MRKINEIFYSLQGEGFHTGTPAVFIRFSGCNLKCSFCDTQHEEGVLMSDEEILDAVGEYPATTVILTGGEPFTLDRPGVCGPSAPIGSMSASRLMERARCRII